MFTFKVSRKILIIFTNVQKMWLVRSTMRLYPTKTHKIKKKNTFIAE